MLTREELSIVKMYAGLTPDLYKTIDAIKDAMPSVTDPITRETMTHIVMKLTITTKEGFKRLNFGHALTGDLPEFN